MCVCVGGGRGGAQTKTPSLGEGGMDISWNHKTQNKLILYGSSDNTFSSAQTVALITNVLFLFAH